MRRSLTGRETSSIERMMNVLHTCGRAARTRFSRRPVYDSSQRWSDKRQATKGCILTFDPTSGNIWSSDRMASDWSTIIRSRKPAIRKIVTQAWMNGTRQVNMRAQRRQNGKRRFCPTLRVSALSIRTEQADNL